MFLSLAFMAWPIRSPNYFYVVDRRIWLWNWSRPGKAANSGAVRGPPAGHRMVVARPDHRDRPAGAQVVSLRWLLQLGMPVPEQVPTRRMILWLTTFGVQHRLGAAPVPHDGGSTSSGRGAASAGVPAAISLGIAAGAGATIGKIFWYEAARRGIDSDWAQKKLSSPKVQGRLREAGSARMHGRPWYAAGDHVRRRVGRDPAAAGDGGRRPALLKMPMWVFIPTVFVGRTHPLLRCPSWVSISRFD